MEFDACPAFFGVNYLEVFKGRYSGIFIHTLVGEINIAYISGPPTWIVVENNFSFALILVVTRVTYRFNRRTRYITPATSF